MAEGYRVTEVKVSEMGPGPELDALVAERVSGWEWRRSSCSGRRALYAPGRAPEWMQSKADMSEPICHDCLDDAGLVGDFHPSTDLTTCAAAAEEWRAQSERRLWWRLCSGDRDGTLPAVAIFEGSVCLVEWSGESLAHALALALLKACGA